jgi:hypothetical protein
MRPCRKPLRSNFPIARRCNPASVETGAFGRYCPTAKRPCCSVADMASHVIALMRARIAGDALGARF